MRVKTRHSHPQIKPQTLESLPSPKDKLSTSIATLNKSLSIYPSLLQYTKNSLLPLYLPETLLYDENELVLMFSDSCGTVRTVRGDLVKRSFMTITQEKFRLLGNLNPQGLYFPKFITFSGDKAEFLIHRKADLRSYIGTMRPGMMIQRFIWPEDFIVKKVVILWKRTKKSKVYTISPRKTFKPISKRPPTGLTLDSTYIPYTHFLRESYVTKEKMTEEIQDTLDISREVLMKYALRYEERLEELLVYLCKSQDGKLYFLNSPLAKVSIYQESPKIFQRSQTSTKLCPYIQETDTPDPLRPKFLPYLNLSDMTEQSKQLYQLQFTATSTSQALCHTRTLPEELAARQLTEVTTRFDTLMKEAKELKREFGVLMKVQFTNYPRDMLDNIIHSVYGAIQKDPRLSKYYPDKSRIYQKLIHAVKSVFLCGLSRNIRTRMHTAHMGLGVTHADFDLYVKYFTDAMRQLEVREADRVRVQEFLETFRLEVVELVMEQGSS